MTEKNEIISINSFFQYFLNFPLLGLSCIIIVSLLLKFSYFDSEIPLTHDALQYFFYALDTSMLGHLPTNYSLENNGWPAFLSIFFSFFKFDEVMPYIQLQRILTVILSTIIIIPIYLLCRKFADKSISLIASAIFAFEPRIIGNSLFGLTEPLYILLCSMSVLFFLSDNKKIIYSSFALVSFATLVRSEAIFLFIVLSVMFFIKFRHDKFVLPKYVPALLIFALLLLPMTLYRIDVIGNDGVVGRVIDGIDRTQNGVTQGIFVGLENYFKFLGWDLIPLFIFFVPIGFFLILKNLNYQKITIIFTTIVMSLPAIYAYSIPALDTRFLFILYPMFCVFSALTLTKFVKIFSSKNKNLILIFILGMVLSSSVIFLEYKIMDTEHDEVNLIVAKYLIESPKVIAGHVPPGYLEGVGIIENWIEVKPYFFMDRENGISVRSNISDIKKIHTFTMISTQGFDNIEDFIEKNKENGLTFLVTDENKISPKFLLDIFENEEKYPYLIKKLDTSYLGYSYHVKIFEIDYEKFLVK